MAAKLVHPCSVGLLLDVDTGRLITLAAHSVVGRSPMCLIRLDDQCTSAEHAAISWTGARWEVRDLGSLNGTWINEQRLRADERVLIQGGAKLGFGAAEGRWLLADDRAAGPAARNERTGELVHSSSPSLELPTTGDSQATVFAEGDGQWFIEQHGRSSATAYRARVELDGVTWTLFLPTLLSAVPATLGANGGPLTLTDIRLSFSPSADEEHVDLLVHTDQGKVLTLPARSSHYTLLTLARLRLRDAADAIDQDEQGWIHAAELADMLRYTAERLNVEIFRARTLFAKIGIVDSRHLIERRASSRQLRLGVARLNVRHM